jgi:glutathione-regulated potassium-efflux system ancillary protein KefG
MHYLPPFAVQGTHRLQDADLESAGTAYGGLLQKLVRNGFDPETMSRYEFMNDWLAAGEKHSA